MVHWVLLPAATKLGQGNVFTGVCVSVPPGQTPPSPKSRHPLGADPQGRHPQEQTPPGADTPRGRHPQDQTHTPRTRHPQDQTHTPGQTHPPPDQTPPRPNTFPEQTSPGTRHPPPRHTVNERPVRILLECILVISLRLDSIYGLQIANNARNMFKMDNNCSSINNKKK